MILVLRSPEISYFTQLPSRKCQVTMGNIGSSGIITSMIAVRRSDLAFGGKWASPPAGAHWLATIERTIKDSKGEN